MPITILQQPYRVASNGVPISVQPIVQALDANGYPLVGLPVTVSIQTGDDKLKGTLTAVTDAHGIARFTDLTLALPNHANQLVFEAPNGMQSAQTTPTLVS